MRATILMAAVAFAPAVAPAQSLLDRTPNLSGNWTGSPGTLYFHFLHRFATSDAPERKVSNVPTFLVGGALPRRLFAGVNYSTNSTLAPGFPNEWELFARWLPLSQDYNHPLDLGAQVGYNNAADGVDAELSVARRLGPARLLLAGRALANPFERGKVQYAGAAGAAIRVGTYVSLTGDVTTLTDLSPNERVAWGAGVHFAIPLTPHTVSLQATNTLVGTLQGASRGTQDVRYGFEFTIPLTLRRYFGRRAGPAVVVEAPAAADTGRVVSDTAVALVDTTPPAADTTRAAPDTTRAVVAAPPARDTAAPRPVARRTPPPAARPAPRPAPARISRMNIKNLQFLQQRLEVTVGTTVEWTNGDPLPHTVTASDKSFDSGLIQPGKSYRRTFSRVGTFEYYCTPHPFMKGTVVVRPAGGTSR